MNQIEVRFYRQLSGMVGLKTMAKVIDNVFHKYNLYMLDHIFISDVNI